MEAFIVGIAVGAVLVYFYHKRMQPKPDNNDSTGIPSNPLNKNTPEDKK